MRSVHRFLYKSIFNQKAWLSVLYKISISFTYSSIFPLSYQIWLLSIVINLLFCTEKHFPKLTVKQRDLARAPLADRSWKCTSVENDTF